MNKPTIFAGAVLACALLAALAAPSLAQHAEPAAAHADSEQHAEPLALDADARQQAGIVLAEVAPRALADELKAPGEVQANAYATVLVSPRTAAQVLARKARLGDVVAAGDPLVELSSVEVAATQSALIVAEQDWQRIAALGPQAVSARRYHEARAARDLARAKLRAYGLTGRQIDKLLRQGSPAADGSFELLAPAAGRITSDAFLVGEHVEPGRTLFTLVKEDSVWVEAQLIPADASRIDVGDAARVIAHGGSLPGTVVQLPHRTNESTRTLPVRVKVDNPDDLLHPGELVEVRLTTGDADQVLAVPAAAIVLLRDQTTVFIAADENHFKPVAVVTGETRSGWTVIRQGLAAGDSYVREGAFALKARLLRSQIGDHH